MCWEKQTLPARTASYICKSRSGCSVWYFCFHCSQRNANYSASGSVEFTAVVTVSARWTIKLVHNLTVGGVSRSHPENQTVALLSSSKRQSAGCLQVPRESSHTRVSVLHHLLSSVCKSLESLKVSARSPLSSRFLSPKKLECRLCANGLVWQGLYYIQALSLTRRSFEFASPRRHC